MCICTLALLLCVLLLLSKFLRFLEWYHVRKCVLVTGAREKMIECADSCSRKVGKIAEERER